MLMLIIQLSQVKLKQTNSKYLIGYLGKTMRPLVLKIPKMSEYVAMYKVKEGNNKLMSFCIDDEKLLEMYKAVQTKIEDFKNIKLNALPVYDDRYIKTKIRTFDDKVYTNFCGLIVPGDDIECESFAVVSAASIFVELF